MAEHFTRFTANYCLKNIARTERKQLERRHLLIGVYNYADLNSPLSPKLADRLALLR